MAMGAVTDFTESSTMDIIVIKYVAVNAVVKEITDPPIGHRANGYQRHYRQSTPLIGT
jgi:hypothetical protein